MSNESRKRTSLELLIPRPAARNFCAFTKSAGFLTTGCCIRAHVGDGDSMDTRDEAKLGDIDAQRRILDLMLKQASCKVACCESVGLCNLSEVIHCNETAAATHVLHCDGRLSWNMLGQAFGEDSPFDVRGTTSREVNDEI